MGVQGVRQDALGYAARRPRDVSLVWKAKMKK
jgi:hypothetical protein